jgi:hypothetical protein
MTGVINMGSQRITTLPLPGASTDVFVASQAPGLPSPSINSNTYPIKAWASDPSNTTAFTTNTIILSTGNHFFHAITIPYAMTINQIWVYHTTGAVAGASGAFYGLGIYNTSGTLLAQTGNVASSGFIGLTGPLGWPLTASYTIQPGNYMIGFLWYQGTGGTPVAPVLGKTSGAVVGQQNINTPALASGQLNQRTCALFTAQTSLYTSIGSATPVANGCNYWTAVA